MSLLLIEAPGVYAVTTDYTATDVLDDAIVVAAGVHNVTILLYSRLVCPTNRTPPLPPLSTARQNTAIRAIGNNAIRVIGMGGSIRGFGRGVDAHDCHGFDIRGVRIEDALTRGIKIEGDGAVVQDCVVSDIYGSTWTPDQYCMGVEVSGIAPTIIGNVVRDFRGTDEGEGVGISITDRAVGALVKGNACIGSTVEIDCVAVPRDKTFAYWLGGASDIDVVHNHAGNCNVGFAASSPTKGLFDENTTRNCNTPFVEYEGDWIVGGVDG